MSHTRSYDPNIIIRAANDKLALNDLNAGQTLFQTALLNWVDDAREGADVDPDALKEAIATLWVAYAHFLVRAKQFKSATQAFEDALECPVAKHVGRVWLEYARFLQDREKYSRAQQVYIRALVEDGSSALLDRQDQDLLWNEFLELSRQTTENPDLTLRELKAAVAEEQEEQTASMTEEPASKRARTHVKVEANATMDAEEGPIIRTYVVTPQDVELESETLTEALQNVPNDPSFMAAWLVRDGDAPPHPPIPLFEAAPPKLSDPTGKDLLGEDMALAVVQRLLEPSGGVVLQVCRALWMWTFLHEQSSGKARKKLIDTITHDYQELQMRLDERLSVAGAAEAAVRMMNDQERHVFVRNAQDEHRALWSKLAWEARQLQWASQQVLNKLQMPGFIDDSNHVAGTTVDDSEVQMQARVCSYLHSAFFLRKRIGDKAHETMLSSQLERLKQYVAEVAAKMESQTPPPPIIPLLPQSTMLPPPPYGMMMSSQQQPQMYPPPPPPPQMGYPPMMGYPQQQQYPPPPLNYPNNPPPRW